jgi:fructosamine-3-kinase
LHTDIAHTSHLSNGYVGDVRRLTLKDGRDVVAKIGSGATPGRALEGNMLEFLAGNSNLPVPRVLFADDYFLLMAFVPSGESIGASAQEDAAYHLAALHDLTAPEFGFSYDTLIGGRSQPNPTEKPWVRFFRDHQLMHMGQSAHDTG